MATQEQTEIRTCITCGDKFADRNTGMADHSQCYDCFEADRGEDCEEDVEAEDDGFGFLPIDAMQRSGV